MKLRLSSSSRKGGTILPENSLLEDWMQLQTWPDCREMVRNAAVRYVHPNGFTVIRTNVEIFVGWQIRIHFWPSGAGRAADFPVHAHGWELRSRVILGALEETTYSVCGDPTGDHTVSTVESAYGVGASVLRATGDRVSITERARIKRDPKSGVYQIHAEAYHSTSSDDSQLSVSLVATATTGGVSRVVVPVGFEGRIETERKTVTQLELLIAQADEQYRQNTRCADNSASFVFVRDTKSRILMVRTRRNPQLWSPVGGREEGDDSGPRSTAVRELGEELGIEIDGDQLVYLGAHARDVGDGAVHFWLYEMPSDSILRLQSSEIIQGEWFDRDSLGNLELFPASRSALSKL